MPGRVQANAETALLDNLPVLVAVQQGDSLVYLNPAGLRMLGYANLEGLPGQSISDVIRPGKRRHLAALIGMTTGAEQDAVIRVALPFVTKDGRTLDLHVRLYPVRFGGGPAVQIVGQELGPFNDYQRLLESITDVCFVLDENWTYTQANQAVSRVTRLSKEALLGKRMTDIFEGITDMQQFRVYQRVMETRRPEVFRTEEPIMPDGVQGVFEVRVYPMNDGLLCIAHDISIQQQAEENLRAQRALEAALRNTIAAINSTLDLDEVLDRILDNARRVVPHDGATIMLIRDGEAHVVRHRGFSEDAIVRRVVMLDGPYNLTHMVERGTPMVIDDMRRETRWISTGASREMLSYAGAPIIVGDEVVGFLNLESDEPHAFTRDQARRLQTFADQVGTAIHNARLYERIQEQVSELEARNTDLKVFAHAAAHDLRSPLQVVLGMADLMADDEDAQMDPDVRHALRTITEYAHRMRRIIDNLITLALIRDKPDLFDDVDVYPIIDAALETLRPAIKSRGITLTIAEDMPLMWANGPLLEQVFANLIGNAIKYIGRHNEDPRIEVRAYTRGNAVRCEVVDNGIGVPKNDQDKVFEAFTRSHPEEGEGYGLGLSIIRQIVESMGGTVGMEPNPEGGSIFWFELPNRSEAAPS